MRRLFCAALVLGICSALLGQPAQPAKPAAPASGAGAQMIRMIHGTEDDHLNIAWNAPQGQEKITGFKVERAEVPSREFVEISPLLPPEQREFVDDKPKKKGTVYSYRIVMVAGPGAITRSAEMQVPYSPLPVPPLPQDVKASFVRVGNKRIIRLSWAPKAKDDAVTQFIDSTRRVRATKR